MHGKTLVSKKSFIPLALLLWLLVALSFTLLIPRADAYDSGTGCPANNDEAKAGVNSPQRFRIYNLCQQATGTVTYFEKWSDGDWNVYVNNLDDPSLWTEVGRNNLRTWDQADDHGYGSADMIWEAIPSDQGTCGNPGGLGSAPERGDRVTVYGVHVFDKWHSYTEIHPIAQITNKDQTCTRSNPLSSGSSDGGAGKCKETWGWGGRDRC
jgi:hypothetical protein